MTALRSIFAPVFVAAACGTSTPADDAPGSDTTGHATGHDAAGSATDVGDTGEPPPGDGTAVDATNGEPTGDDASDGDDPASTWVLIDAPVALGETITDVVAGDDAVWIAVSSVEGVRVLASTDLDEWSTISTLPDGLPADLERGRDGDVWFAGGWQFLRLALDARPQSFATKAGTFAPASTWIDAQGVLGFGSAPYNQQGRLMTLQPEPSFAAFLSSPLYAAGRLGSDLIAGNDWGVVDVRDVDGELTDVLVRPCGWVTDVHPHAERLLVATRAGVILEVQDDLWSYNPTGADRVYEIASRGGTAWAAGDHLLVRDEERWWRLDEPDAPSGTRRVSLDADASLYVVAGENELWRRSPGPATVVDWDEQAHATLTLSGVAFDPLAVWIWLTGGRLVLHVLLEDPAIGTRTLTVDYAANADGSLYSSQIIDAADGRVTHLSNVTGDASNDTEARFTQGDIVSAGNADSPAFTLTWSGPYPDWS